MKFKKYQEGGQMPADPGMAPAPGPQEDPLIQLAQMAAQALQEQNCEAMAQVCEGFLMLIEQASAEAPMEEPQGEPVFKKGGKMIKEGKGVSKAMKTYSTKQGRKSCK